jgi:hypothetical protein
MKDINLGQASQVLANIGVMLGIVFLAIEIRQNQATLEEQNTLTTLSARDAAQENNGRFRVLLLENPELLQVWQKAENDESLDEHEMQQFRLLCSQNADTQLTSFNRFSALGKVQEVEVLVELIARNVVTSERIAECWGAHTTGFSARGYSSFVNAVDQAIERK